MQQDGKFKSGWYKTERGNTFHVSGEGMSLETVQALARVADLAQAMTEKRCPECDGAWPDPLKWDRANGWHCDCGWKEEIS